MMKWRINADSAKKPRKIHLISLENAQSSGVSGVRSSDIMSLTSRVIGRSTSSACSSVSNLLLLLTTNLS